MRVERLEGKRHVLDIASEEYPDLLRELSSAPRKLYLVGDPAALQPGLAVIGARRATPYGLGCAARFARIAAEKGVSIISGGARGCDSEAHRAALAASGGTVVFLGGGCDRLYPAEHGGLFQDIVNAGGAVVSEHPWDFRPMPYAFRARNRLIAGLAEAVLIVEAGLPSGTFSTADEALAMGKEVLVVPGAITSPSSRGSNRLLYQGAIPVVDDESFEDVLFSTLGVLRSPVAGEMATEASLTPLVQAVVASPLALEHVYQQAQVLYGGDADVRCRMMTELAEAEAAGIVSRYPDGTWGPAIAG